MVRLLVLDLDGTLLNSQSEISNDNLHAIKFAEQQGIKTVIATGRGHFDVQKILEGTGLSPWVIGANGATIHKPDGSVYKSFPLEKEKAIQVLKWLETNKYYYEVFSDRAIYTPTNGRKVIKAELDRLQKANPDKDMDELRNSAREQFKQFGFEFVSDYKEIEEKNQPIYNILAFSFDEEKLREGIIEFKKRKDLHLVSSGFHNFEIENGGVSKGSALRLLSSVLETDLNQTLVIGDSINDISMLKVAGVPVAMGNASKQVIDICSFCTATNDQDGVAKAIHRFL